MTDISAQSAASDRRAQAATAPRAEPAEAPQKSFTVGDLFSLEVIFLCFVGGLVILAFVEATTYKLVSSRTPFVIMVPLMILIVVQMLRVASGEHGQGIRARAGRALRGGNALINAMTGISLWMAAYGIFMLLAGHYVASFAFIALLVRRAAREPLKLALILAACTTAAVFVVFEYGFQIELYRGLIYRWFAGYRVF